MRFPSHHRIVRPLSAALAIGAAVLAGQAGLSAAATTPTTPMPTINKAALGSGGGAFCDGIRANFLDIMGGGMSELMAAGLPAPATVKAFVDKNMALNAKLLTQAPDSLKPSLVITQKSAQAVLDALKKAGYDFTKIDSAALSAAMKQTPETKAAQAKVNGYMTDTCHIDLDAVLGLPAVRVATPTTKKK